MAASIELFSSIRTNTKMKRAQLDRVTRTAQAQMGKGL